MRVLFLTIAMLAFALPAFAHCGGTHEASSSGTVATNPPPPPDGSGG